jgi:hypothetical protein
MSSIKLYFASLLTISKNYMLVHLQFTIGVTAFGRIEAARVLQTIAD